MKDNAKEEIIDKSVVNGDNKKVVPLPFLNQLFNKSSDKDSDIEIIDDNKEVLDDIEVLDDAENKDFNFINVSDNKKDDSNEAKSIIDRIDAKKNLINDGKNIYGVGKITKIKDFILEVSGLENVSFYEKVNIANKAIGYVTKLENNHTIVALLTKCSDLHIGDEVYQTNEEFMGEYALESMGRIVDLFGRDKLDDKKYKNTMKLHIEMDPIHIMDRRQVNRPLETGIIGIDLIYPIGKGQRQLILGDKKTGKTQLCLDTIANQLNKKMICIYVALGKTKKEVKEIYYELVKRNAASYTIIISAFYDELPTLIYLTPYFALSVANYYMMQGYDVLVVLDDLKRHADSYRQISLISGKSPGRDAYPSDIFYAHSRLLERGCQYKNGASITILPIVETKGDDITDYISTNIISITDGQIVLSSKSFKKGEKPAINYGLSVSRLGGAVQTDEMKSMGATVRRKLLNYLETRDIYELANIDEMSKELQNKLFEGKKILDNLKQYKYSPQDITQIRARFKFLFDKDNKDD